MFWNSPLVWKRESGEEKAFLSLEDQRSMDPSLFTLTQNAVSSAINQPSEGAGPSPHCPLYCLSQETSARRRPVCVFGLVKGQEGRRREWTGVENARLGKHQPCFLKFKCMKNGILLIITWKVPRSLFISCKTAGMVSVSHKGILWASLSAKETNGFFKSSLRTP